MCVLIEVYISGRPWLIAIMPELTIDLLNILFVLYDKFTSIFKPVHLRGSIKTVDSEAA